MKYFFSVLLSLIAFTAYAEGEKHPRVIEVEEKLRDEASRYFTRRFPGEPFFIRADVNPMRRISKNEDKSESLPYLDAVSEEDMDEWDDPTTPLAFLRSRVTKITLDIAVPDKFNDEKVASIKEELLLFLKLLPFRDEVRVEKKLKSAETSMIPPYFYAVSGSALLFVIVFAFILRGIGQSKVVSAPVSKESAPAIQQPAPQREPSRVSGSTSAKVSGDVTFHDPLKMMDIVSMKIDLIQKSGTFPTLKDMMLMDQIANESSTRLAALIHVFPENMQKEIFSLSSGQNWLEAFAEIHPIDHEGLATLARMARERSYRAKDRDWENLLIQLWRMGDKSVSFLRKLQEDEAFSILAVLPKSLSLTLAKKAFPGTWGRILLDHRASLSPGADSLNSWCKELQLTQPKLSWDLLENYRKDREILSYLDHATIEEEKDIYQSLKEDSFVFSVRPPFYQVFDLSPAEFQNFLLKYPLDKWALVVMNSSRTYIKQVSDNLDEKKRMVFSNHLRNLDLNHSRSEQIEWRRSMALAAKENFKPAHRPLAASTSEERSAHAKTA